MTPDTIQRLQDFFTRYPSATANRSVSPQEVRQLESDLGFSLPDDYKQFLFLFGAGSAGPYPIFGFGRAEDMSISQGSAWATTLLFREDGWDGTENWLVFSVDNGGNPVGLDRNGAVWISDHGSIYKLADSFEGYLRKWCWELE